MPDLNATPVDLDAPVTREHRLEALRCLLVPNIFEQLGHKTRAWVDTGVEHDRSDPSAALIAQAIANAEARGHSSVVQTQGWVKREERMPEPQQWVLVFEDGAICVAHWGGGPMWWPDRVAADAFPVAEVTHWMPLPQPPGVGR